MNKNSKIYVAGHNGLVGSSVCKKLRAEGYNNIKTVNSQNIDLRNQHMVNQYFLHEQPEYVFMCAAQVGGIHANNIKRAEFMYDNLMIQCNIINSAYLAKVKKLLFLGSTCIYPKNCPQPIKEEYLLTSELEQTNEPYAIAKIAGLKMIESYRRQYGCNYISVMPTNLYGSEKDNYDLENSHVFAAMIRKIHEAKVNNTILTLWGDGSPFREFLHVDDLADALLFLMNNYDSEQILNIGTGEDISIKELAEKMCNVIGYDKEIIWDSTKPNGTSKKLTDVTKLRNLGWKHKINLDDGIKTTYEIYKKALDF